MCRGQLVGIPLQEYTAGPGIVIDSINKVISTESWTSKGGTDVYAAVSVEGTSVAFLRAYKQGNLVLLSGQFDPKNKITIAANSYYNCFVLKPEFYPRSTVFTAFGVMNSASLAGGGLRITNDGVVSMMQGTTAGTGVRTFSIAYITA